MIQIEDSYRFTMLLELLGDELEHLNDLISLCHPEDKPELWKRHFWLQLIHRDLLRVSGVKEVVNE